MNITSCRVCRSKKLEDVIDLGIQPWGNDMVTKEEVGQEKKYPLVCCFCHDCSTLQVRYTVPKEIMYANHSYLSGSNKAMPEHFQKIADYIASNYCTADGSLAVDIGSNDGTLLRSYQNNKFRVLGVEASAEIADIACRSGIPTIAEYFNKTIANDIEMSHGKAMVISAANVFYHVEELHSIVEGVKGLLDDAGVFVVHASYLPNLIKDKAFDIMYHEHLLYYRMENLQTLLSMHGLEVFDFSFEQVHGGSIIVYACHKGSRPVSPKVADLIEKERKDKYHEVEVYKAFNADIQKLAKNVKMFLSDLKNQGATIAAYGAPVKGTVMLNYCGIDERLIDFAAEVNELKVGRYIPGTGIEIKHENDCTEPDYYFLLSWNFKEFFIQNREKSGGSSKFIVPIPFPHVV
ncbi:class I SAM-dependent methyltransferase [Alphaproteobacteria bacterium]|nr:class I SAM-dependent methyltransferase [Alphaproteobacteria bacterium]MDB2431927.1 class I SAM-dependent methyltransferase [Alphaproteobacteria bacterium]MDB2575098.1 class I SAM-dependent methyltransferase [Alphaproteobacteria bacterium]MDB2656024.1 class I SAM-dependent methyltransferase [Alphaproteobacteria bacterium]